MKPTIEQIIDRAIRQLRTGTPIEEVLSSYPEYRAELLPMLAVIKVGLAVPVNTVPRPVRRQLFAEKQKNALWLHTLAFARWAAFPVSVMAIFLGGYTLMQAADNSLPQDNLYSLKRAKEELQVSLTKDTDKQAALQMELTKKRLNELKLATHSQNPGQQAAALAELNQQTEKTFSIVPQVAAAKALTHNDSSLLSSLVEINKQQKAVVSTIAAASKSETTDIAATTLSTVEKNGETLAVLIAAVHEQSLADLNHKVSITGEASLSNDKGKITVDKTTFVITKDTVITSPDGKTLNISELASKSKVNIVGTKDKNNFVAKIIAVITVAESPALAKPEAKPTPKAEVRGAVTTRPASTDTRPAPPATSTTRPQPKPDPVAQEQSNETPAPDPNEVTGGFIIDNPKQE